MSVSLTDPDCYKKIVAIEGSAWAKEQADHVLCSRSKAYSLHTNSFFGAIIAFVQKENAVIYGYGGFNRYVIRDDGRVVFLRHQAAYPAMIEKAQMEGFDIE